MDCQAILFGFLKPATQDMTISPTKGLIKWNVPPEFKGRFLFLMRLVYVPYSKRYSVTQTCFIQVYQNIQKDIRSYVLVSGNQRLFGRDRDGGEWHSHPIENPDSHDFSEDGTRAVSFEEFLYEVSEKLVLLGIL